MTEFSGCINSYFHLLVDPLITAAVKKYNISEFQNDEGKFSIKYATVEDLKYVVPLFGNIFEKVTS